MKIYTLEEVNKATLAYFDGDQLATDVWVKKYALKNQNGDIFELTPDDMHRRLAKEYARIEANYPNPMGGDDIYQLLKDFKYIVPGGSQLSGAGNDFTFTSLSNCFVIESPIDSYGGIMKTDQEQVQIMKRRGGVGHDLSTLRPAGSIANNSVLKGMAGSTLYMERYSNSTREVSQGDRRGALMLSMDVQHPDADRFIDAKLEEGRVTGANISVRIRDNFMKAVNADQEYFQTFPIGYNITPFTSTERMKENELEEHLFENDLVYIKKIKAKKLWDKIIHNAWKSAEPGILFWDTILKESPAGVYGSDWEETSTNPCGEIPLCPYDSCRLSALNLYSFVEFPFTKNAKFDFVKFRQIAEVAQRLMDDLIDLEIEKVTKIMDKIVNDPEPMPVKIYEYDMWYQIREKAILGRRTGLGITAEGDMLAALGFKYGTPEATEFSILVHKELAISSYRSSVQMAKERGAFPIFDRRKEEFNSVFLNRILEASPSLIPDWMRYGRRNIANLTIAPTGSLSLMTKTTSGIEPLFYPFHKRRRKTYDTKVDFTDSKGDNWEEYIVLHDKFVEWFRINNDVDGVILEFKQAKELLQEFNEEDLEMLFRDSPYYGATANDINWEESVKMQGGVQKWVDHSISKTINLPAGTTVETVDMLYRKAYEYGCKGVTCYVDGSRDGVIITDKKEERSVTFDYINAYKRPKVVECDIYHKTALKQDWMVLVGLIDGKPYELFALDEPENAVFPKRIEKGVLTKVKSKTYSLEGFLPEKKSVIPNIVSLMTEDERIGTRKYSSMLRHGMHPKYIIEQIEEFASISSFDKVIQRILRNYINEGDEKKEECPECRAELRREEACIKCVSCTYSKCG